jgi:protein ImuB
MTMGESGGRPPHSGSRPSSSGCAAAPAQAQGERGIVASASRETLRTEAGGTQLTLLPPVPAPIPNPGTEQKPAAASGQPLWMAVWLPHLALDALVQTGATQPGPLIIVEGTTRPRVHDGNRAARQAGVRPGMALADALAVLNAPVVVDYVPESVREHLQTLASVLLQFSDHVCPEPGQQRILLEAGRSLRLFRGLKALERRVGNTLRQLGYSPRIGGARTPAMARLLAELGHPERPRDRDGLRRVLTPLPLAVLPLPAADIAALRGIGLTRIGELLRLPRADLALRYGTRLPELLDRLLGDVPEAMPRFQPPDNPSFRLEFDHEVTATGALRFPLKRLLLQLEQVLRVRHRGVQGLELRLLHRDTETRLTLERSRPGSRAEEWLELWSIRLSRTTLPAPVRGLRLQPARLLPITGDVSGLFGSPGGARDETGFLTRLRARLGDGAVLRFVSTLYPLPEQAQEEWISETPPPAAPFAATPAQRAAGAALWLRPLQPCPPPGSHEWLGRMEGGWWADGNDQRRDYALARDSQGRLWWVFRDLRSGQWQLQGFWG